MSILLDGGKKTGRGTLKGITAVAKRGMHLSQKLKIEFSAKRGGPCGENRRTFVDEVVMFTRKRAPLIGVRRWKDVKENVKTSIAYAVTICKWHMHIYSFISCIYSGRHFISYLQKVALKISIFFRTVMLGYRRHWWNEAKDLEDCTTTLQSMASHF